MEELLQRLDGTGSRAERAAMAELRTLEGNVPATLRRRYHVARSWKARAACVYYSLRYARMNDDAVELGREALQDKATGVRYRACMLLSFSLRKDALPGLREALERLKGKPGSEDVAAAIDAIEHQNHNYFVDRDHSERMTMAIESE